jgi:hypothetical protein
MGMPWIMSTRGLILAVIFFFIPHFLAHYIGVFLQQTPFMVMASLLQ